MVAVNNKSINSKSWPFQEANRVLERCRGRVPKKGFVLFETGFGPSGLPHIGTFGEVMRTSMVKHAFEQISDIPTKLICFSDDMDGLRKVPENVPNYQILKEDLNLPLSKVRDPFGEFSSFAEYNNEKLKSFLDKYDFSYEFVSSTSYYQTGKFDEMLIQALKSYEKIMEIMLPSLGQERQASYSPFMPICKKTGYVLQVATEEINLKKGTLVYRDLDGDKVETKVTGGNVKLQWKPDWAMRWCALDVDYEMHGKDLIPSAELGKKLCAALNNFPPELYNYELFLDENGHKISKSKGNGLSIEEWLKYADQNSLSFFMFQKPKTAKRLYFDIVPKVVDEYHRHLKTFPTQDTHQQYDNPVWHVHEGNPPSSDLEVSFSMLLNLVSASGASDKNTLWGFIERYAPHVNAVTNPGLDEAVSYAVSYYKDFVEPQKTFRLANDKEMNALRKLADRLTLVDTESSSEELQKLVYSIGMENNFDPLKDWFCALYNILFGESQGPRFGGFIALYGIDKTINLIERALAGELIQNKK